MQGLIDSTLREGMQTVGVALSLEQQVELAGELTAMGIEELEVGPLRPDDDEAEQLINRCRGQARVARLAIWCRCQAADIEQALAWQPEVLALSIPVSSLQMQVKLQKGKTAVKELVVAALRRARGRVGYLSLGLEDATRAEPRFLAEMVRLAKKEGAHRVRLADTVGIATPAEIIELVRQVREVGGRQLAIGVHTHNDFGMAGANAIAALGAGADWADVTLLGLGERAGLARLEEVAGYLALRRQKAYQLAGLPELCARLADFCDQPLAPRQPVVGRDIFACETGLHLAALQREPATYEPFEPALVGNRRRLLYGTKTGRQALAGRTAEHHSAPPVGRLRKLARQLGRPLDEEELAVFLQAAA
ncbi:MAG: pyruvate carboxyltransferase [Desulfurivibrio sp.]|nr:pyruvate carboxyltransferase [Desulfurivibrio sp.]